MHNPLSTIKTGEEGIQQNQKEDGETAVARALKTSPLRERRDRKLSPKKDGKIYGEYYDRIDEDLTPQKNMSQINDDNLIQILD